MNAAVRIKPAGSHGLDVLYKGRNASVHARPRAAQTKPASKLVFMMREPAADLRSQDGARDALLLRGIIAAATPAGDEKLTAADVKTRIGRIHAQSTLPLHDFMKLVKEACRINVVGGKYEDAARILLAFNMPVAALSR